MVCHLAPKNSWGKCLLTVKTQRNLQTFSPSKVFHSTRWIMMMLELELNWKYSVLITLCLLGYMSITLFPLLSSKVCSLWPVLATEEDWSVSGDLLSWHHGQGGRAIHRDDEGSSGGSRGQGYQPVHLPFGVIRWSSHSGHVTVWSVRQFPLHICGVFCAVGHYVIGVHICMYVPLPVAMLVIFIHPMVCLNYLSLWQIIEETILGYWSKGISELLPYMGKFQCWYFAYLF